FNSLLSLDTNTETICKPSRFIVLWSVSKDFGLSQARVAVAAVPENPVLKDALTSLSMSFRISSLVNSFFVAILSAGHPAPEQVTESGSRTTGLVGWFVEANMLRLYQAKERLWCWCTRHDIAWLEADAGQ
ncbi:hypothetical protein OE88DRAFT_1632689, partial [Heliocybe sulcata]